MKKSTRRTPDRKRPLQHQVTQEHRARLAAIVDSSDDAIASKTLEGIITSWNRAAEKIFGYTAAEAIGQHITMIIPRDRLYEEEQVIHRIVNGEMVDHFETVRVRKDGTRVDISLTVSPLRDKKGRIIGASKIARDITAQKQAERELRLLYEEAEEANRAKDEFLAMLGHELRNPLGAISNAVSLLEQDTGERALHLARGVLHRQVASLARMIDDLLDVGRMITGKILLRRAPLDLKETVIRALNSLRAAGHLASHEITFHGQSVWIDADDVRIDQIVANLVGNAVKYTPSGGSIRVSVEEDDGACLRVQDSGLGMPSDLVPRVFDLFVQGTRSLARSEGGLGVGLTIVRRLAELHAGSVNAFSAGPGQGSEFSVRFPRISAPRRGEVLENSGVTTPERLKILVVEDNRDSLEMLQMLLSAKGHEVHGAVNGKDALDYASRNVPDVAIIDLGLPVMDGYELAMELRKRQGEGGTLLVALTGYGSPEDKRRTASAGFDAHLLKPFDYEKLTSLLREQGS